MCVRILPRIHILKECHTHKEQNGNLKLIKIYILQCTTQKLMKTVELPCGYTSKQAALQNDNDTFLVSSGKDSSGAPLECSSTRIDKQVSPSVVSS